MEDDAKKELFEELFRFSQMGILSLDRVKEIESFKGLDSIKEEVLALRFINLKLEKALKSGVLSIERFKEYKHYLPTAFMREIVAAETVEDLAKSMIGKNALTTLEFKEFCDKKWPPSYLLQKLEEIDKKGIKKWEV